MKKKIHCLVIDDEPLARALLVKYIKEIDLLELVASCATTVEAFNMLQKNQVDLIFLDIQLPRMNGLSFLKQLKNPPKVIITTAYPDYAIDAFELDVVDYVMKPVIFERLIKAIEKLNSKLLLNRPRERTSADSLFIKVGKRLIRIQHTDILYIEALGDYIKNNHNSKRVYLPNETIRS